MSYMSAAGFFLKRERLNSGFAGCWRKCLFSILPDKSPSRGSVPNFRERLLLTELRRFYIAIHLWLTVVLPRLMSAKPRLQSMLTRSMLPLWNFKALKGAWG